MSGESSASHSDALPQSTGSQYRRSTPSRQKAAKTMSGVLRRKVFRRSHGWQIPLQRHASVAYAQKVIANLKSKTGRKIDEWIAFVRKSGPEDRDRTARRGSRTPTSSGPTTRGGLPNAPKARAATKTTPEAYLQQAPRYVEDMYAGQARRVAADLRGAAENRAGPGREAKACPCKTIVPLYREHVFAEIKPATNSGIDLGLALGPARRSCRPGSKRSGRKGQPHHAPHPDRITRSG